MKLVDRTGVIDELVEAVVQNLSIREAMEYLAETWYYNLDQKSDDELIAFGEEIDYEFDTEEGEGDPGDARVFRDGAKIG